jgi:hypothetical protein
VPLSGEDAPTHAKKISKKIAAPLDIVIFPSYIGGGIIGTVAH